MSEKRYTREEMDFLRGMVKKMPLVELVQTFNTKFGREKSQTAIKSTLNNYGISRGIKREQPKGQGPRFYTEEQKDFIRRLYLEERLSAPEVTKAFNEKFYDCRTEYAINGMITLHGFRRSSRLSKEINVGDETLCRSTGYITVKTDAPAHHAKTKRNYRYKHLAVWEAYNGPVPKGHVVRFLDGNTLNCEIENLALFTRSEHGYMNTLGYNEAPEGLRETIVLTARLMAKTKKRERELDDCADGDG